LGLLNSFCVDLTLLSASIRFFFTIPLAKNPGLLPYLRASYHESDVRARVGSSHQQTYLAVQRMNEPLHHEATMLFSQSTKKLVDIKEWKRFHVKEWAYMKKELATSKPKTIFQTQNKFNKNHQTTVHSQPSILVDQVPFTGPAHHCLAHGDDESALSCAVGGT